MSVDKNSNPESNSFFEKNWAYIVLFLIAINVYYFFFYDSDSFYGPSNSVWYADFRFWPQWISACCWLAVAWGVASTIFSILISQNKDGLFLIRRSFYQKTISFFFITLIGLVWYSYSTLPLATVFFPLISPLVDYVHHHYTIPLADYYTTGEGANPLFWPAVGVIVFIVLFVVWRVWFYLRRWKQGRTTMALLLIVTLPIALGAADPIPAQPKKVETSVGIYDVQSKGDLLNFSAEDIRELVKIEDDRIRSAGKPPHPILVYCFEERSFQYTGGKYDNAEIKYRLRVPPKITPGKKYPLIIHLHGVGEAGNDNTLSLAHLHSVLPLMVGPDQQDFFLLVTQCPSNSRYWEFSENKDGNLDVMLAALENVTNNFPIDDQRTSVFGLSSGGYGVWLLLLEYPEKFSAAAIASISVPDSPYLAKLTSFPIWAFRNKSDSSASVSSNRQAMRIINGSGGYMKLTQFDLGGHAAWRPAMDEYNCFAWMIAQKRGGWFNPPPERKVYTYRSMSNCFFSFFLPLGLAVGLFAFQRTALCERLHERIADRLYRRWGEEDEDDEEYEDDDEEAADDFRILTDITGTKNIKAKILGFQGDAVRIESPEGKIALAPIKQFSVADQELLRKIQVEQPLPEGFRKWSNISGTQTFVAKFIGFQGEDKVLLQSQTGKTMPVPINQLGVTEQDFLASQREQSPVQLPPDGFRIWTDTTGAKKITAKLVEILPDGKIRLESQAGKAMAVNPKFFCEADQQWIRKQQPSN